MNKHRKAKNDKVIYTVITSDYDYLRVPRYVNEDYDYICFTDNKKLKSDFWNIYRIQNSKGYDSIRLQKQIKICAHRYLSKYKLSVYMDANMRIVGDVDEYRLKYMENTNMLCVKHPDRSSVFQEADECIRLQKDNPLHIKAQIKRYLEEGYEDDNRLIASGVLVRYHNDPQVIKAMETWWSEVENGSIRDQLSFNYACWKTGCEYSLSNEHIYKNQYWVCPGIHTKSIEETEDHLIDYMLLAAYRGWYIKQLEEEIQALKNNQ